MSLTVSINSQVAPFAAALSLFEAGESLGFLPGSLEEKINPYLRPLSDALSDINGAAKISRYMASGVIEASPLRGQYDALVDRDSAYELLRARAAAAGFEKGIDRQAEPTLAMPDLD